MSRSSEPSPPRRRAGRPSAGASDTPQRRTAILLAAEKLFAQHGYHAVSLRDIAAEADVPVALLAYYYGAKHELYHAIFESWLPSIQRRRALLDAALATPEGRTLEAILAAFIGPLVELNADPAGQYFAKMASRELTSPTPEAEQAGRLFIDPMSHAFIDALQALFPGRSRADVAWCYQFMLGATLHFLADRRIEGLSRGTASTADREREPMLRQFVAAGFRATLGPESVASPASAPSPRESGR